MKEVKILHLFPQLLSLYGEYGNVAILKKTLEDNGHTVTLAQYESGALTLDGYDFVYIGSGTEGNLLEAVKRLMPYAQAIKNAIDNGQLWLATGNAMAIFGGEIEYKEADTAALDALPYSTIISNARYMGDVLTNDAFGAPFVGFVNTSCEYQVIEEHLLEFRLGAKLGNTKGMPRDGILAHNFYGTQLLGPVLTKNPHFLQHICKQLTGEEIALDPNSNICKAYEVSLSELSKRLDSSK